MITPAISVLGAVEGLEVATPAFAAVSCCRSRSSILVGLFLVQRAAPAASAACSGRSCCVWFVALAVLGHRRIVHEPARARGALSPATRCASSLENGWPRLPRARLGRSWWSPAARRSTPTWATSARPIRLAWFGVVLPALLLNYFGQGALLLARPAGRARIRSTCWRPTWALLPAGRARDGGDGDRVAGADLRRVLAHAAGGAARLLPARADRPHLGARSAGRSTCRRSTGLLMVAASRWCSASARRATWRRRTASR